MCGALVCNHGGGVLTDRSRERFSSRAGLFYCR